MVLFAFRHAYLNFDQMFIPIQLGCDAGVPLLLCCRMSLRQLSAVQEKFFGDRRIGDDVSTGGVERGDVATQQKGFPVFYQHITVYQLDFLHAQAFHLPALQDQTGLAFVLDKVVVPKFFVLGDGGIGSICFFGFGTCCRL